MYWFFQPCNTNFGLTMFWSFRLRLELSLCMRSSFCSNLPRKLSNCTTNVRNIPNIKKLGSKITKLSFNSNLKTSCHLPPYYSLELNLISSTSHSLRQRSTMHCSKSRPALRQSRFTRFAASAEENFILRAAGSSFHAFLVRFSCFSEILQICWFWELLIIKIKFLDLISYT